MIRKLRAEGVRVESGVVQFGEDWPGVFIRGDEALALASKIEALQLDGTSLPCGGSIGIVLNEVVDLLKSCQVSERN